MCPAKSPPQTPKSNTASNRVGFVAVSNQLFAKNFFADKLIDTVFLREDMAELRRFRFHKQRVVFEIASLRAYADELRQAGYDVTLQPLAESQEPYEAHVVAWARAQKLAKVCLFEVPDKPLEGRLLAALEAAQIPVDVMPSPMFLTSRARFADYLGQVSRPFMKTFYERQRRRLDLLVHADGSPEGGQWSFDELNRQRLPAHVLVPDLPEHRITAHERSAQSLCANHFADHPGELEPAWLPTTRAAAKAWLEEFVTVRLAQFGPFEDALSARTDVLFHSVLTPFLNAGLLTPGEVIDAAMAARGAHNVPLASIEGFVRQIIGWREFIFGIYRNHSERQEKQNFWRHERKLSDAWWQGNTGIPPLDQTIDKARRLGWTHHIERLMVAGNLMLLLGVQPKAAHDWFMEMYIDSSEWVMGPNVYGMALFSDGGIFATKPYICGANYYRKMGDYPKGDWCDGVDGLYWRFIDTHRDFMGKNPRLNMMVRALERLSPERKTRIYAAAQVLQDRLTT